jgi:Ca2+-binding RTX toxin-like protein
MTLQVNTGNLDALIGVTFGQAAFANLFPTLIDGSITNSASSPDEVVTYNGTTGTIGIPFFPMKTVSFEIASVSDSDNTLVIDAYVGSALVGIMDFTVVGFGPEGIALAGMPLASLITQSGNLPGLAGSTFVLGLNAAGAKTESVDFSISGTYNFIKGAAVHYATAANPVVQGGTGPQMIFGLSGSETITAGPNENLIYGGPGTNVLTAGAGKDTIFGGSGANTIYGGSGTDVLHGTTGTDTIVAGTGHTVAIGGTGTDTFIFAPGRTGGSTAATADIIQHFLPGMGDTINLSAFDATLPASAGGHMTFIGTAAFDHHAGELRYDVTSTGVTLWGDTNGDGIADFVITMTKVTSLIAHDFVL